MVQVMCLLHTNIERETLDDCRFSFDVTSTFTHQRFSLCWFRLGKQKTWCLHSIWLY